MHTISRHFGTRLAMIAVTAIAVASVSAPAAADAAAPRAAHVATKSAKSEKLYCVEDAVTGTRIRHKDCRTIEQWKADGYEVKAKK